MPWHFTTADAKHMKNIVGILLAAGSAKRFGTPKLLHPLADGVAIGVTAANNLLEVIPEVIGVVQPEDHALMDAFRSVGITIVNNDRADEGMGASLAAGIKASSHADGWLVTLADMPWIQPATIAALASRLKNGASMVAPVYKGERGHPVGSPVTGR